MATTRQALVKEEPISAHRARVLTRFVRNIPTAVSVLWRQLDLETAYAVSVTLRAMPSAVRSRLVRVASRRATANAALVVAADGNITTALEMLQRAAARAKTRQLRRLVAAAAALDAPVQARQLLNKLPTDDSAWPRLEALVRAREGHLAAAAAAPVRGQRGRRLRRRLSADLRALSTTTVVSRGVPATPLEPTRYRVLHLVTNALPEVTAGYTVRTHGIAAAQARDGFDVHVLTRLGFPVSAGHLTAAVDVEIDDVQYHRLLPRWRLPTLADKLLTADIETSAGIVQHLRPAVLHAHSKHVNAQVALALRARYGLPVVYEVRGFLEETWRSRGRDPESDLYRLSREIETECMRAADAVVTISEGMRDEIVSRGVPAEGVTVIPNAVDDAFLAEPPDPSAIRHAHGIQPHEVVFGVVSTLNAYEGVHVLIDAVADLRDNGLPVRLLVVGDGPSRVELADEAARRGVSDVAVFTGQVSFGAIRAYHAAIDVFCVPRVDAPVTRLVTPLKPLEAMATGKPVVASDLPPLREIIQPETTGLLVAPGDSTAFAAALESLTRDTSLRAQLGKQAQRWVSDHRTWTSAVARYRDVYQGVGVAGVS